MNETKRQRLTMVTLPSVLWGQIISFGSLEDTVSWAATSHTFAQYSMATRERLIAAPFADYVDRVLDVIANAKPDHGFSSWIVVPLGTVFLDIHANVRLTTPLPADVPLRAILQTQVDRLHTHARAVKKLPVFTIRPLVKADAQRDRQWDTVAHSITYSVFEWLPIEQDDEVPDRLKLAMGCLTAGREDVKVDMSFISTRDPVEGHNEEYAPSDDRIPRMINGIRNYQELTRPLEQYAENVENALMLSLALSHESGQ